MIINRSALDRGFAHATLIKTETVDLREGAGRGASAASKARPPLDSRCAAARPDEDWLPPPPPPPCVHPALCSVTPAPVRELLADPVVCVPLLRAPTPRFLRFSPLGPPVPPAAPPAPRPPPPSRRLSTWTACQSPA